MLRPQLLLLLPLLAAACQSAPKRDPGALADTTASTPAPPAATSQSTTSLAPTAAQPVAASLPPEYIYWNLPEWVRVALKRSGTLDRYELFTELNPFYLAGQFDDDSLPDIAIQIREKPNGRRGVLIIHRGTQREVIVGAGNPLGNGGEDWSWLWEWQVVDATEVDTTGPKGREVLLVAKPESASAYLWWDGAAYQWRQAGD